MKAKNIINTIAIIKWKARSFFLDSFFFRNVPERKRIVRAERVIAPIVKIVKKSN
jgi:hypothetical protein